MHFLINLFYKLYMNLFIGPYYSLKGTLFDPHRAPTIPDGETGKTIVITGGSRGIGLAAVKKFLKLNCRVIIGCRTVEAAKAALIDEDNSLIEIYHLDLMKMDSVRLFAQHVIERDEPIHCLVNNAGIMFGGKKLTEDGFESQMATNYFGHFLLCHLLMNKLEETGTENNPARIINVSSCAHFLLWNIDLNDLNSSKLYTPELAYGVSKSSQVMFSQYLDSATKPKIRVFALHPGVILSDLFQQVKWMLILGRVLRFLLKNVSQGGDSIIYAALAPELKNTNMDGFYLDNSQLCRINSICTSISDQSILFEKTCALLKISKFGTRS